jgi:hypothetical protein
MGQGPPDPSIINSDEERNAALAGGTAQQAAADGLEAGLRAKAEQNAEGAPAPDAPQPAAEPAQPPQAAVAVAEAPPAEKPASGVALGLDAPPRTITSAGTVEAPAVEEELSPTVRRFACAKQPNGKFLVRAGTVMRVVDPNSPSGLKAFARDGDKFIKFIGGVSEETRDLEVIAFCENHQQIYDVADPKSALRFDLEKIQQPTATNDPVALPSLNIEAALKGEDPEGGLTGDSPIGAARRQVQEANERN